jgi:hypothetical protein
MPTEGGDVMLLVEFHRKKNIGEIDEFNRIIILDDQWCEVVKVPIPIHTDKPTPHELAERVALAWIAAGCPSAHHHLSPLLEAYFEGIREKLEGGSDDPGK